ncbi:MAG: hypothetical protein OSB33_01035 [Candidatus Poseidoniales archaeon]|nr:hypothetical protein [Candidatus Poseidoniales archaeon]
MRRVGVVGDGLSGLIAGLAAASSDSEVVIFGRSEPIGGLASPVDSDVEWLFDRIPLFWRRGGKLDILLRRLKVPMRTRKVPPSRMAIVRDDCRYSLPKKSSFFRKSSGTLSAEWASLIQAARKGDLTQIDGFEKDAATLLSILWNFNPTPDPEAVLNLGWKQSARVVIDGWVGVSGRLITACMQTDVTFLTDGPVTGFRRRGDGTIDGVKRKGKVLPVDAVIRACARVPPHSQRLHGRYLGLEGNFLHPHVVLWDADREVLLVDLGELMPERVPKRDPEIIHGKYPRSWASLFHCIAFGDSSTAAERIEGLLDSQCSGWRGAIAVDYSLNNLKMPTIPDTEFMDGVHYAHVDNAFKIGKRASQS